MGSDLLASGGRPVGRDTDLAALTSRADRAGLDAGSVARVPETRDYESWHTAYDDPGSGLSWRLATVRRYLAEFFDQHEGPVRVVSACAGDGRDLIGALAGRADADRVQATLLEVHPRIAEQARRSAAAVGLSEQVQVRTVDAGSTDAYLDLVPADLVLLVGIFGNIGDSDLDTTIDACPALCAPAATVVWSRSRDAGIGGDRNEAVRARFARAGFTELDYATLDRGSLPALGAVRYDGPPTPLPPGQRLFTFQR